MIAITEQQFAKIQKDESTWIIAQQVARMLATEEGAEKLRGAKFYDYTEWDPETEFFKDITRSVIIRASMLLLSPMELDIDVSRETDSTTYGGALYF